MSDISTPLTDIPIERHGVVGDRRTAALVAADGTLAWLCLPDYDGPTVFGALLDNRRGGHCRLGPAIPSLGSQRYRTQSAVLTTTWTSAAATLELTDAMAWPWDDRGAADGADDARVVIRRLRAAAGAADCVLDVLPRADFDRDAVVSPLLTGALFDLAGTTLRLWASRPVTLSAGGASTRIHLQAGEELWVVLATGDDRREWTVDRARTELERADSYWREWIDDLAYEGPRPNQVRRSALNLHLLSYAPTGSPVAAPTTSLPERIGGDRNWDYRYAWVRDASLSLTVLARLGKMRAGQRYMDCLTTYRSSTDSPLQVVYGVDGRTDLPDRERHDLAGYRGSLPVRFGNRACGQRQLDSLGFFTECALVFLQAGGEWREQYWRMVQRAADFTAAHWREPDRGIWEGSVSQHYVSSKVMAWVALDRAVKIAERTGHHAAVAPWRDAMSAIHDEVREHGWSERLGAFSQRYEGETLDASTLLIPIMGFLPASDPRCRTTAQAIAQTLTIDGLVHRYVPAETPGHEDDALPVGEFEGAFVPCCFWLATVYAQMGRRKEAAAILDRAEGAAGPLGLFAEEIDARAGQFLGNVPVLFSHAEHLRAILALADADQRVTADHSDQMAAAPATPRGDENHERS